MFDSRYLFTDRTWTPPQLSPDMCSMRIESNGEKMLAMCLKPGGRAGELHPAAILLHGFPGNEQNLDLAQALRHAGMAVLTFHYRGCWGSHGDYRFTHLADDTAAAADYLRHHAGELGIDPGRIYLIGHSMGGFAALHYLSRRPAGIKGGIFLAPCDIGEMYLHHHPDYEALVTGREDYFQPACKAGFDRDCAQYAQDWTFPALARTIEPTLPLFFVGALRDTVVPPPLHIAPIVQALRSRGGQPEYLELNGDHNFSSCRISLIHSIGNWLDRQETPL